MTAQARKEQVLEVALNTIGEHGVHGTTISRIAKGAGVTTAALYTHFENRQAILLAALDVVYDKIYESHRWSSNTDALTMLREMCEHHAEVVADQKSTGHAHLFLEFVAAAAEDGLRDALREKELASVDDLASIIEECKQRSTLVEEVDSRMIAWFIAGWAWTGDVAHSMGVGSTWQEEVSPRLLDLILDSISQGARGVEQGRDATTIWAAEPVNGEDPGPDSEAAEGVDLDGLPDGTVFTLEEVADIFRVPVDTIHEIVRRREIPCLALGSEMRIPRRALIGYLRAAVA